MEVMTDFVEKARFAVYIADLSEKRDFATLRVKMEDGEVEFFFRSTALMEQFVEDMRNAILSEKKDLAGRLREKLPA